MHSLMNRLDVRCEGTRRIQCNRRAWGSAVRVVGCLPCAGPRKPVRYTRGFCFDLRRVVVGMQGSGLDPGSSRRVSQAFPAKVGLGAEWGADWGACGGRAPRSAFLGALPGPSSPCPH